MLLVVDYDPMVDDYESERNSYLVDTDDPGVAVRGYSYGQWQWHC